MFPLVSRSLLAVGLVLGLTQALAAQQDKKDKNQDPGIDSRFEPGSMLSDGMIEALIKRYADDLASKVGVDDNTEKQMRKALEERWVPFLKENRDQIAPLVGRFYEAMVDPDPPPIGEVKEWAEEALKIHDIITREIEKSDQDVAKLLSQQQIDRFRTESAKMRTGLGLFRGELVKWQNGNFDYSRWNRRAAAREGRRQRRQNAVAPAGGVKKRAEVIKDEMTAYSVHSWDQYVIDFSKKFGLDEAQKLTATAILGDVKDRALAYVKTRSDEIEKTQSKLTTVKPSDRQRIIAENQQLLKPLEDLFAELQTRLDVIPTDAQRANAEPRQEAAQLKAAPPDQKEEQEQQDSKKKQEQKSESSSS